MKTGKILIAALALLLFGAIFGGVTDILHAASANKECTVPFYKKGFDIEYVDANTIKITPGVMDVEGTMFTSAVYSRPLKLDAWIGKD